ncbi:MAG: flagellar hook-basal body complex protein FliE [Boseongicola sp.]
MELKSIQAFQGYAASKSSTAGKDSAGQALGDAARDFGNKFAEAEKTAMQTMTVGADPHALVEALANTQLAVETAVTVRDRVVEAYQEILRMPV